jgi:hypothetical protein
MYRPVLVTCPRPVHIGQSARRNPETHFSHTESVFSGRNTYTLVTEYLSRFW